MKQKTLKEQFEEELGYSLDNLRQSSVSDNVLQSWNNEPYSELMATVAMLKGIYTLAQSFHWQASGTTYYADHLLFQRVYEGVVEQIDMFGERAIGLSKDKTLANPSKIEKATHVFVNSVLENKSIIQGAENSNDRMFRQLGYAETVFVEALDGYRTTLNKKGLLTTGVDNLIAGALDAHETFVYLLKQRTDHSDY